jgi:hypothetical protein
MQLSRLMLTWPSGSPDSRDIAAAFFHGYADDLAAGVDGTCGLPAARDRNARLGKGHFGYVNKTGKIVFEYYGVDDTDAAGDLAPELTLPTRAQNAVAWFVKK